jgi:hypothetical protein
MQTETKHKAKYYTCKRLRLLEHLLKLGFKPVKTIPDATNINFKWWLFDNTPALQDALYSYFKKD